VLRGPQVLAADEQFNAELTPLSTLALASQSPRLRTHSSLHDADGLPVYETDAVLIQNTASRRSGERATLRMVPFAAAGATGKNFVVWLGAAVG
jgi:hypothetical protein